MQSVAIRFITLVALVGALGCAGDGVGPSATGMEDRPTVDVAGSYGAKTIMTTRDGVTTDQIAAGVTLTLVLSSRGTTSGELLVPASAGGTGVPVDLTGTWELAGTTVRFIQAAETFLGRIPFVVSPRQLAGEATIGGTAFQVVLTR
jgi:hypothetical protein